MREAWRWLIAGEWRAHPMRFLLAGLAIAVGVALGFAVHVINRSAADWAEIAIPRPARAARGPMRCSIQTPSMCRRRCRCGREA